MDLAMRALTGAAANLAVAVLAYRRGSLTGGGAATGWLVGEIIFVAGGAPFFAVLLAFFVTSSALGRVGAARKQATKREFSKGDRRDALQVLANGGVATLCALAFGLSQAPLFAAGYLGALGTATGDTWATELGTLARGRPRSVLTLRPVPAGTSGAVSGLGLSATLLGAALMGAVAAPWSSQFALSAPAAVGLAALGGFVGAAADSLLGAGLQAQFHCPACGVDTEGEQHHCGSATRHVRGLRVLGNDGVNAVATWLGALTAMAASQLL